MCRSRIWVFCGINALLCSGIYLWLFVNYHTHEERRDHRFWAAKALRELSILGNKKEIRYRLDYTRNRGTKYRILCWILTDPDDLQKRTIHVKNTWTRRCDKSLFMSSAENKSFPTIGLNVSSGREHIAAKSKAAWVYIYNNFASSADYFMKADPDTYVIIENLRNYLSFRDSSVAEYFGHSFKLPHRQLNFTYMSGGSGLVLSKEALRLLVTKAFFLKPSCIPDGTGEDWKTAQCLSRVGAKAVNTTDELGRERFLPFTPLTHILGQYPKWYYTWDQNRARRGLNCCSKYPISFHYMSPRELNTLEYLFYHVRVAKEKV
ncbi:glycoprotein-N-acetylgalactosamine 3-beta-galactosyltransferase 1 isoform X2 [Lingula anatina]|uniref:N-acetylgalactosaminide beta-1,3-galactosyltransferase n=1 Tax=Lingula anatina TaxID=7574 RepID=A0A1S3K315_LINAN|nr:glycoprotein-N-acetylgalactosamine 3-beta-galactosyltransferase 1 isoform X2 [Lingula anatina]XP_013416652.1 glycoprotein-N-acetylgalactosamine 3-beta-galactosyltransferase 1 isoform X2 [Lingula anatina]|eukprot:XP_013416651.1 glycoprotein-N-acetylgalactosamine 3-beta-galactosyltransferase 1 isoform X2 [Lingula anatina]